MGTFDTAKPRLPIVALRSLDTPDYHSRNQLQAWLRDTFDLNISGIEDCSNGAIYLQILDRLTWGTPRVELSMKKVRWNASSDNEKLANYKLLQHLFDLCDWRKEIPVNQLIKGKYAENLQFLQWCRALSGKLPAQQKNKKDYNPIERRLLGLANGPLLPWAQQSGTQLSRKLSNQSKPIKKETNTPVISLLRVEQTLECPVALDANCRQCKDNDSNIGTPKGSKGQPERENKDVQMSNIKQEATPDTFTFLTKQDLLQEIQFLKSERNFYFTKLHKIETLCQEKKQKDSKVDAFLIEQILFEPATV